MGVLAQIGVAALAITALLTAFGVAWAALRIAELGDLERQVSRLDDQVRELRRKCSVLNS